MRIRGWGEPRLLLRGAAMVSAWTGFVCFSLRPFYARFHVSLSRPWFVPGPFFFFFFLSLLRAGDTELRNARPSSRYRWWIIDIYVSMMHGGDGVKEFVLFFFIFRWINRKGKLFFLWNNIDKCFDFERYLVLQFLWNKERREIHFLIKEKFLCYCNGFC